MWVNAQARFVVALVVPGATGCYWVVPSGALIAEKAGTEMWMNLSAANRIVHMLLVLWNTLVGPCVLLWRPFTKGDKWEAFSEP